MAVISRDHMQKSAAAASLAGARLRDRLRFGAPRRRRGGASSRQAVTIVEIGLIVLIGIVLARIVLSLASPLPAPETPPPAIAAGPAETAAARHPFRLVDDADTPTQAPAAEAAETTLDLTLHGTWIDEGGRASAIVRIPGGDQVAVAEGDEICCNATLDAVFADRITIMRGGVRESLRLPNKLEAAAAAPAYTHPAAAETSLNGRKVTDVVRIQPIRDAAGLPKIALFPAQDESAFETAGFQAGDILVAINNQPAPSGLPEMAQLLSTLQGSTVIAVTVERDGVSLPLEVDLSGDNDEG